MKKDIHPQLNTDVTVTCACGSTFVTQSTMGDIKVDICSKCHPLYTGKQKFIDTEGRIDKFNKKMELAKARADAAKTKKSNKKDVETTSEDPKSLKELLQEATK